MTFSTGTIADLATIEMGQSPGGDTVSREPIGLPLLNGPTEFGPQHPAPVQWTGAGVRFARSGDILLCVRGSTTGRMNRAEQDYAIGRGIAALRARDVADSRIVKYALDASMPELLAGVSGSVFPNLSREQILHHPVPIPPKLEQEAIVEALGALDDKIAANNSLMAGTLAVAQVMADVNGPTVPLGHIVAVHKTQTNPSTLPDRVVELYSLPAFDAGAGPVMVPPSSIKSGKFEIKTPSVLVSKLNPRTPRVWSIAGQSTRTRRLASTEFLVLEPLFCHPSVLWALLTQPIFGRQLEAKVGGTSGSHQRVRPEEVLATPVCDPRWLPAQLISSLEQVIAPVNSLASENSTLREIRDTLLPQLMSGRLRVRDAEKIVEEAGA